MAETPDESVPARVGVMDRLNQCQRFPQKRPRWIRRQSRDCFHPLRDESAYLFDLDRGALDRRLRQIGRQRYLQ